MHIYVHYTASFNCFILYSFQWMQLLNIMFVSLYTYTLHALNCASLHIVRIIFVGDDEVRFVFINIE